MQFRDLTRQYQALRPAIDEAVASCMASGAFIQGDPVVKLEQQLAQYVGTDHCVSCANGTDALLLALKVWHIGPGDAVFVPDFTFFASAEVVAAQGATPIFVEVDPRTFNLDPAALERRIATVKEQGQLRPRAIIAVDLFGQPADFGRIGAIAEREQLLVLEDGAQGFGGAIGQRRACSFGHIATTSFFPAKPLGCYGDGGALFTNNAEWAAHARSLAQHGRGLSKYEHNAIGLNSRLDTLQAAILSVKLKAFQNSELQAVNHFASLYTNLLDGAVLTPYLPQGFSSSWAQYTVLFASTAQRDAAKLRMAQAGIPTMIYYPSPMHLQPVFAHLPVDEGLTSGWGRIKVCLSLPIHPYLTDDEVAHVCSTLKQAIND
ncbi:MAG: DegT/DnrJ/EryC1/StrS family aminotransferase [Bacteroidales bacterium]|nr:DegT/DnrJ/EryC1/StrS family aminotransferase [Bacteroidales bacterium]